MKVILNETKELPILNVSAIRNGLSIKMDGNSVDSIEEQFLSAGELEKIELAFDDSDVFGRYYNMSFESISKTDGIITVTLFHKLISASIDVAAELTNLKGSLEKYQLETASTQELQDAAIGELADMVSVHDEIIHSEDTKAEITQEVDE